MSIAKDTDGHGTALQLADAKAIPVDMKDTMLSTAAIESPGVCWAVSRVCSVSYASAW